MMAPECRKASPGRRDWRMRDRGAPGDMETPPRLTSRRLRALAASSAWRAPSAPQPKPCPGSAVLAGAPKTSESAYQHAAEAILGGASLSGVGGSKASASGGRA